VGPVGGGEEGGWGGADRVPWSLWSGRVGPPGGGGLVQHDGIQSTLGVHMSIQGGGIAIFCIESL